MQLSKSYNIATKATRVKLEFMRKYLENRHIIRNVHIYILPINLVSCQRAIRVIANLSDTYISYISITMY